MKIQHTKWEKMPANKKHNKDRWSYQYIEGYMKKNSYNSKQQQEEQP